MTQGFEATDNYGKEKMIDPWSYRSAGATRCKTVKPVRILVFPYTCFDPEKSLRRMENWGKVDIYE